MKTWMWFVRGIARVAFGVLTVLLPQASITALVFTYGFFAVVDGGMMLGLASNEREGRAAYILGGLLGIAAGVIAFVYPGLTASALYYLIGAWATVTGVIEIVGAMKLRNALPRVGGLAWTGVLSLAFGIVLFVLPRYGVAVLLGMVAAYAIVSGIAQIVIGVRVHELVKTVKTAGAQATA